MNVDTADYELKINIDKPLIWVFPADAQTVTSATIYKWFKDGAIHRENGPAIIKDINMVIIDNGKHFILRIMIDEWYRNGKRHREDDEPSVTTDFKLIYHNCNLDIRPLGLVIESWYKDGEEYRDKDHPAKFWDQKISHYTEGLLPCSETDEYSIDMFMLKSIGAFL